MYVKFVFSGILKELLDQMDGMDEKMLSKRVIGYIVAKT